eukprot:GHVP01019934.1.p1 GENE.GHVP01019934.1~~GHVP01019934.1.p1  ORF type:complete len:477 (+),score=85.85 GHVP01019934.1:125-1555(+)
MTQTFADADHLKNLFETPSDIAAEENPLLNVTNTPTLHKQTDSQSGVSENLITIRNENSTVFVLTINLKVAANQISSPYYKQIQEYRTADWNPEVYLLGIAKADESAHSPEVQWNCVTKEVVFPVLSSFQKFFGSTQPLTEEHMKTCFEILKQSKKELLPLVQEIQLEESTKLPIMAYQFVPHDIAEEKEERKVYILLIPAYECPYLGKVPQKYAVRLEQMAGGVIFTSESVNFEEDTQEYKFLHALLSKDRRERETILPFLCENLSYLNTNEDRVPIEESLLLITPMLVRQHPATLVGRLSALIEKIGTQGESQSFDKKFCGSKYKFSKIDKKNWRSFQFVLQTGNRPNPSTWLFMKDSNNNMMIGSICTDGEEPMFAYIDAKTPQKHLEELQNLVYTFVSFFGDEKEYKLFRFGEDPDVVGGSDESESSETSTSKFEKSGQQDKKIRLKKKTTRMWRCLLKTKKTWLLNWESEQ